MRSPVSAGWAVAASVVLWGCAASADGDADALASWTLAEPSVRIGLAEGDSVYLFQRIVGVHFGAGEEIVVADGGLGVIRIYDEDGVFARQVGGRGDGPGEFQSLRAIWVTPSGLLGAWDSALRRFTYFHSDGSVTTHAVVPSEDPELVNVDMGLGALVDGSVVLGAVSFESRDGTGTDRVAVVRFSEEGGFEAHVGTGSGFHRERYPENRGAPTPFSPYPYFAVYGEAVYHTSGADSTVTRWSDGSATHIHLPGAPGPTPELWGQLGEEIQARGPDFFKDLHRLAEPPDEVPDLAGLLVDSEGRIWAKRYDPLADALWLGAGGFAGGGVWWVADSDGAMVAASTMPAGFRPLEVNDDLVVGLSTDDFGVQRVEVRRILR